MRFTVRERSVIEIDEPAYRVLEGSAAFWSLVESGIFSLVRTKGKKFGLKANAYVGQFSIGENFHIQIAEKVPGSVAGLIKCSAPADLKTLISPSLHTDADLLLAEYAKQLVRLVGRYVSKGRLKAYHSYTNEVSNPKGRIDVKASARLLGRGKRGKLVCKRDVLSADLAANQLLGLSLALAEPILRTRPEFGEALGLCRMYSPIFEDVSWRNLRKQPTWLRERLFSSAFNGAPEGSDLHAALGYARALILHLGSWMGDENGSLVPHSYFMNLESLFESAVRKTLQSILGGDKVQTGSGLSVSLFEEMPDRYVVDPDLVIFADEPLVGDCKWKDLLGHPDHSDVYQLAAHAQALGAKRSLLILPGNFHSLSKLGTTRGGLEMYVTQVRAGHLFEDISALASELQLSALSAAPIMA